MSRYSEIKREFPSMTSLRNSAWEILLRPQIGPYIFSLTFTFYHSYLASMLITSQINSDIILIYQPF